MELAVAWFSFIFLNFNSVCVSSRLVFFHYHLFLPFLLSFQFLNFFQTSASCWRPAWRPRRMNKQSGCRWRLLSLGSLLFLCTSILFVLAVIWFSFSTVFFLFRPTFPIVISNSFIFSVLFYFLLLLVLV